jgi:para-nitrobenzyl esterase
MLRSGASEVFAYRFDWADQPTRAGVELSKLVGAAHALEIPFVFGHFDLGRLATILFTDENLPQREKLSKQMRGYWAQFAREGKPGKGSRGDGPEWTAWTAAADTPRQMVLNVPVESQLRMTADKESVEGIISSVDADARLPAQKDKCGLFRRLSGWSYGLPKDAYPTAGAKGCAQFPYDGFPWEEKK